tara:strand:+ start:152 stop:595 length:444 start_codon:yes stop_codon:yes gene_type:complete
MKLIAHKGNVNGPNPSTENTPQQIEWCIENGYDVEIDVRYNVEKDKFYLGHDESKYEINWWWLAGKLEHLWIHCKDLTTLHEFTSNTSGYNYFWHQGDDYTLTSQGQIWASSGKPYKDDTVIVIENPEDVKEYDCYGICSDYVGKIR